MKRTTAALRIAVLGTATLALAIGALADIRPDAVLPVVGSIKGGFGSDFRTSALIHNRTDRAARGEMVFHPAGVPASASDPKVSYDLEPRATLAIDDLVATLGAAGLGSIDVFATEGAVPAIVARAFDAQPTGTNGDGIPLIDVRDALVAGDSGTLITPGDFAHFRFNVGIRTLGEGAAVKVTVWTEAGVERSSVVRSFPADFFQQQPAADFVLGVVAANDAISVEILSGSAVLYGSMTDNTTNDPAIQVAVRDEVAAD